jgi:N-acetylmuramoyl-L-alanine amidase
VGIESRASLLGNDCLQDDYSRPLKRASIAVALAAMALWGVAAPARELGAQLDRIALETDGQGGTVLTLSLSQRVTQHIFRLQRPERLVIDLPDTRRRATLPTAPEGGVVAAVRSGVHDRRTLRLVVELRSPVQPQLLPVTAAGAYQLRIGLAAASAQDMTAAAVGSATTLGTATAPAVAPAPKAPRSVRAAHAPQGAHSIIVAVDAGHGGDDPGATGVSGTHEKDVTLAIARSLAARIDREPGMHAVLTRDGDYFVDLRARMDRAHAAHADMFVSIHADAVRDRGVSGASVYILSERGASSEAARTLAEQQNAADLKGGISLADQPPDVRSVVLDVAQNMNIGQSVEAADRVLGALDHVGAVRKREVQQAAFVVLKSPDIPSLLIETAYISNAGEERKLRAPAEQQRLADAIFSGIDSYFRKFPPDGSQYARSHGEEPDAGVELARSGL